MLLSQPDIPEKRWTLLGWAMEIVLMGEWIQIIYEYPLIIRYGTWKTQLS